MMLWARPTFIIVYHLFIVGFAAHKALYFYEKVPLKEEDDAPKTNMVKPEEGKVEVEADWKEGGSKEK